MQIFDGHTHLFGNSTTPEEICLKMGEAGIYGGCVFSDRPKECDSALGKSFEARLDGVLNAVRGYEQRLFPVLWIHPYEENIIKKIHIASERGISAFKIICSNFYVYEEKSIEVLKEIAAINKPVFFHTGILWDGQVSSRYNRPINWEALIGIKGLRFSMGHISWPWYDECIALYGKFLNALTYGETSEMFFDLTPGTPKIYREDLLTKIFRIGYNFGDNMFFGTDCTVGSYNSSWAKEWLTTDGEIMDKLSVGKAVRTKMYCSNLMRFLGKVSAERSIESPVYDNANSWNPEGSDTKAIIEHWYKLLDFPKTYDEQFYEALDTIEIKDYMTVEKYDLNCENGKQNLLAFLYFCEDAAERYDEMGIERKLLLDNIRDIVTWTKIWSEVKGELFLGELRWLKLHLSLRLFKLGRLQYAFGTSQMTDENSGIKTGDKIIEVHIPERGPLDFEACKESLETAKEFFGKYFPEYEFDYFTCHSWLLGDTPGKILNVQSNIVKFAKLFNIISVSADDSIVKYVFKWNTTRDNISKFVPESSFAEKIKKMTLAGEIFTSGYGIIQK